MEAEGQADDIFAEVDKIFEKEKITASPDCLKKSKIIFVVGKLALWLEVDLQILIIIDKYIYFKNMKYWIGSKI